MEPSQISRDEVAGLLTQEVDELNVLLAQSDGEGGELFAFEAARVRGEEIMRQLSSSLRGRICNEWGYCARRKTPFFTDRVALAVAVADVILGAVGMLPRSVIAALLVKQGLDALCQCDRAPGT